VTFDPAAHRMLHNRKGLLVMEGRRRHLLRRRS